MTQITIRDATASHAVEVAGLLGVLGYPATAEEAARHIARFAGDDRTRLQVAAIPSGELVGLVATCAVPRLDADLFTCRVTDIVVSDAHRRAGVGTALLEAAEEEAHQLGAPRLDLTSGTWRDDAHAFYTRHGFESRAAGFTKRLDAHPDPTR